MICGGVLRDSVGEGKKEGGREKRRREKKGDGNEKR